eukprot:8203423-Alexandrium_andersonii.AAC.1
MSGRSDSSEERGGSTEIPGLRRVISIPRRLDSGWSVRANSPRSPRSPVSCAGAPSKAAQWLDAGLEALRERN